MLRLLPGFLVFVLWVYCLVEVIGAREDRVRNLSKMIWLLLVLFFPLVGSIAWLVAGRPQSEAPRTRLQGAAPGFPEYDRPGRAAANDPAADEAFLRRVRERAEEQRLRHEAQRREREQREQREDPA